MAIDQIIYSGGNSRSNSGTSEDSIHLLKSVKNIVRRVVGVLSNR